MKKIFVSLFVFLFFFAPMAFAISFEFNDDYYLGSITNSQPASEAQEAGFINNLITFGKSTDEPPYSLDGRVYNVSGFDFDMDFPDATDLGAYKDESENVEGNFGSGWTYLLGKYATVAHVWYVAGLEGAFFIPGNIERGLSHYTLFNASQQVPEPTTLLLFGAGFAGLAMYRRKRS